MTLLKKIGIAVGLFLLAGLAFCFMKWRSAAATIDGLQASLRDSREQIRASEEARKRTEKLRADEAAARARAQAEQLEIARRGAEDRARIEAEAEAARKQIDAVGPTDVDGAIDLAKKFRAEGRIP